MLNAITVIGNVNSGKSTLIGSLLMETRSIPRNLIQKVKDFCAKEDLAFEPAYLVDYLREEIALRSTRERALAELKIGGEKVLVIDTPGQTILSQKMVSGLSEANTVIILLDITDKDVKKFRYYIKLVNLLGFSKIVVVINKLDKTDYKKEVYENFLKKFKIRERENFYVVPISALKCENLVKKSKMLSWHRGRNLIEILKNIYREEKSTKNTEFVMPVQSILRLNKEEVVLGTVLTGSVSVGGKIKVFNGQKTKRTKIRKLYHLDKKVSGVFMGENAGVITCLSGRQIKRGYLFHNLPKKIFSEKVVAGLYILEPLNLGNLKKYTARFLTGTYRIKNIKIKKRFNFRLIPANNLKSGADANEFCEARIVLDKKVAKIKNICARRFVIEDQENRLVAIGKMKWRKQIK